MAVDNQFKETVDALFKGMNGVVSSKTVVGDAIHIGDTICAPGKKFAFEGIPTFAPEHFARVRQVDTMKRKQFMKGLDLGNTFEIGILFQDSMRFPAQSTGILEPPFTQ